MSKVPSTPESFADGVMTGLEHACTVAQIGQEECGEIPNILFAPWEPMSEEREVALRVAEATIPLDFVNFRLGLRRGRF